MTSLARKPVILVILDGWGIAPSGSGNALSLANIRNFNKYWISFPHTQLSASGNAVGLPKNEAGNTETGHLNLGAGKIVYQDLERINMSIADGSFFENKVLRRAIIHAQKNKSNLHLLGLIGAGGVHSNIEHLFALIQLAKRLSFKDIYIHIFTDGRDSPPTSSQTYVKKLEDFLEKENVGHIASLMGRYWSMDRDRRWDRTEKAYVALTEGRGIYFQNPFEAINFSYSKGKTDEFIEPSIITDSNHKPPALISDNDSVIFFNFRIDRPRQLTSAFKVSNFNQDSLALDFDPYLEKYKKTNIAEKVYRERKPFKRNFFLENLNFVTMTEYSKSFTNEGVEVAFSPEPVAMPLGKVIADAGFLQLRIAESEKERFVTYYFNGLNETKFSGEERIIVPSPSVTTYDLKPEMAAFEIADLFLTKTKNNKYSFVLINFANPDMVGHTGNIGSTVKACEVVDECLGKIADSIFSQGGYLIITADHGNAEEMINNQTGQVDTEHNSNPVPFIVLSKNLASKSQSLNQGILADVAPTVLNLLGLPIPQTMTGRNLLESVSV
jgi:2,3-bisphosphoglycerate-independent phosphoglycerate mutase